MVIVFPLPLDSLDPRVYRLEEGEIEFGSKVNPGEASGDETLEEGDFAEEEESTDSLSGHTDSHGPSQAANPSPTKKQLDTSAIIKKQRTRRAFMQK